MTVIIAKNPVGKRYRLTVEDDGTRVKQITITGVAPMWIQQRVNTYRITKPDYLNVLALLKSELIRHGELESITA
ncbi:hypothetical protein [Fibrobacter sp. UWP2]|uniref:hypothetical protein n=1 Tax=Fibrobacter sp. UWP2 TaxID=1896216 RepID=UPI00091B048C|nr:hypothetical protein [Fibrobacter sp. UWP2]SHJ26743.1 hypothetical protein SAMN05720471_12421 [Fibrobacter sp. UWP2]